MLASDTFYAQYKQIEQMHKEVLQLIIEICIFFYFLLFIIDHYPAGVSNKNCLLPLFSLAVFVSKI